MRWLISRVKTHEKVNLTRCESIGEYNNCLYFNMESGKVVKWDYMPSADNKNLATKFIKDRRDLIRVVKQTSKVYSKIATKVNAVSKLYSPVTMTLSSQSVEEYFLKFQTKIDKIEKLTQTLKGKK